MPFRKESMTTDTPTIEVRVEGKRGCGYRKPGGLYLVAGKPNAPCGRLPIPLDVCPCCHNGIKPTRGWTWVQPKPLFAVKPCSFAAAPTEVPDWLKLSDRRPDQPYDGNERLVHNDGRWAVVEYIESTPRRGQLVKTGLKLYRVVDKTEPHILHIDATSLQRAVEHIDTLKRPSAFRAPDMPKLELLHQTCPLADENLPERAGLLWIGGAFYKTPGAYMEEAAQMGLSRRISAIPKDFKVGETWVLLAHRECIPDGTGMTGECDCGTPTGLDQHADGCAVFEPRFKPGIFTMFMPERIEYVVKGTETDDEIESLVSRGITPVKVINPGRTPDETDAGDDADESGEAGK
jgi:hypothetical protein